MSSFDLSFYPQVALVLFLAVFIGICWRTLLRRERNAEDPAMLPLQDDQPTPASRENTP